MKGPERFIYQISPPPPFPQKKTQHKHTNEKTKTHRKKSKENRKRKQQQHQTNNPCTHEKHVDALIQFNQITMIYEHSRTERGKS